MNKAKDHANKVEKDWADKAYIKLKEYLIITNGNQFMCEDVREYASKSISEPPSKRAWGAIIVKAKKEGIIEHCGFSQVSNPTAHRANASLWRAI